MVVPFMLKSLMLAGLGGAMQQLQMRFTHIWGKWRGRKGCHRVDKHARLMVLFKNNNIFYHYLSAVGI